MALARVPEPARRWLWLGAVGCGIIAALGLAPVSQPLAMLVGLALGQALWRRAPSPAGAAWVGWGLGLGYFGLGLSWIVEPFLVDVARHGWMAPFALILLASGLALFWAAAGALARWLAPAPAGGVLAWPVAMTLAELTRGAVLTGFPWGAPGQALVGTPWAQGASVLGAPGLDLGVFLAAALLAQAVLGRARAAAALGLVALVGVTGAFGLSRLGTEVPDGPVLLRLVQPNAPQDQKWDPAHAWEFVERAIELSAAPPAPGARRPDLVIWPEASIPVLLGRDPALQARIAQAAAPGRAIIGALRTEGGRYYNSLVVLGPDGQPEQIYDKHHLVPFGEYVPLGDLAARLGIQGLAAGEGYGYSPGPGPRVLDLGAEGKVLPLICYEAIFPRAARVPGARPDWLLQITNDAWFGRVSGPYQHLAQARLRAIEQGLPLVRVANTGISAVIDPMGRLRAELALGTTGALDAALPMALAPTPYARMGDTPLVLTLLGLMLGLMLRRVMRGRQRRQQARLSV